MFKSFSEPIANRCGGELGRALRGLVIGAALIGYALLVAGAGLVLREDLVTARSVRGLVAALPAIAGVAVFALFLRYLRRMDELERRVQIDALALAGGVGWLLISSYSPFERLGLPEAEPGHAILALSVVYSIGVILGWKRFR